MIEMEKLTKKYDSLNERYNKIKNNNLELKKIILTIIKNNIENSE